MLLSELHKEAKKLIGKNTELIITSDSIIKRKILNLSFCCGATLEKEDTCLYKEESS